LFKPDVQLMNSKCWVFCLRDVSGVGECGMKV